MMIVVRGCFRLSAEHVGAGREALRAIVEATRLESGCRHCSCAEDLCEAGLFRLYEEWSDRAALAAHQAAPHMRRWQTVRETFGFHDREVVLIEASEAAPF